MLNELTQEIERIHHEQGLDGTRALVIASAVEGVFCAGADLTERKSMTIAETQDFLARLRTTFNRLATLPVPAIACVSGKALGGGLELALCCHLRVFSSDAVVGLPETRLSIIPGAGGTYRLSALVGMANALDLILTGRQVPAVEAAEMGLCNRLVGVENVNDALISSPEERSALALRTSMAMAEEIGKGGPVAVRAALVALASSGEEAEKSAYESVLGTQDRIEALRAFSEKRKPVFMGK